MISMSRYISIISGVGAGAAVAQRQLIMRAVTQNSVLPPGLVAQFANSTAVGAYFGTSSEEYYRAVAYFAFINKNINSPQLMSFSRWVGAAIAPMIVGDSIAKVLASFVAQTSGTLTINDGATPVLITGLNFSTATTLTASGFDPPDCLARVCRRPADQRHGDVQHEHQPVRPDRLEHWNGHPFGHSYGAVHGRERATGLDYGRHSSRRGPNGGYA